jgi:uridine kinase
MRPHLIGIAGPSSSGKSELARAVARRLPGTEIVSLDSYYRALDHLPLHIREKTNFDHPDSLEWELLHEHLEALVAGKAFDEPLYDFANHTRAPGLKRIKPGEFLIVEGLFVFHWPELRDILDTRVYVQTDPEVCFQRRLQRDVAERGRTPESVREQYERTVRPGAEQFVYPSIRHADLVISGESPLDETSADVLGALRAARAAAV